MIYEILAIVQIRDTVKRTYDQIWNIFKTLTSVGLTQACPNYIVDVRTKVTIN